MNSAINNSIQNQTNFQARIKLKPAQAAKILGAATVCSAAGAYSSMWPGAETLIDSAMDKGVNFDSAKDVPLLNSMVDDVNAIRVYRDNNIETPPNADMLGLSYLVFSTGTLANSAASYLSTAGSVGLYKGVEEGSALDLRENNIPS